MTIRVCDVLKAAGCPLVEVAADEPLPSIAGMMAFAGLSAVLQVAPCGRPVRLLSEQCLVHALIAEGHETARAGVPWCTPADELPGVVDVMLQSPEQAVLVEHQGDRIAILTLDAVADFLCDRAE